MRPSCPGHLSKAPPPGCPGASAATDEHRGQPSTTEETAPTPARLQVARDFLRQRTTTVVTPAPVAAVPIS